MRKISPIHALVCITQLCMLALSIHKYILVRDAQQLKHEKQDIKTILNKKKDLLAYKLTFLNRRDHVQTIAENKLNLKPIAVSQIHYLPDTQN